MNNHAMISFYVQSAVAGRKFLATTANQVQELLERVFRTLESEYGVRLEDKRIIGLDGEVLQRWFISASSGWKPATINSYVNSLNPFFRWAHRMSSQGAHYLEEDLSDILKNVKIPSVDDLPEEERPKDKYYTDEQVEELLYGDHGRNQVRDRAIMALILCSGLRVSELCSLKVGQFRNATDGKIRLKRKGGAYATAFIGQDAVPLIEAYLKTRKNLSDDDPLFITTHGKPCSRTQIYKALSSKQDAIGLAKGPHTLRHTFISTVTNQYGVAVARDLAGHKSIQSMAVTNRYVHTTEEQRMTAANQLHLGKKGA